MLIQKCSNVERNAVFLNLSDKTSEHSQLRFQSHRIQNWDLIKNVIRRIQSAFLQKDSWLI